jgi:hypothetical protein
MGYDDGGCDQTADGLHVPAIEEVVVNATGGRLSKVHRCVACGIEFYEASDPAEVRPPL